MGIVKDKLEDIQVTGETHPALREQLDETEVQFQIIARQWLEKERQLQELAHVIRCRDQQNQALAEALTAHGLRIAELEHQAAAREAMIEAKDLQLQTQEVRLEDQNRQLLEAACQLEAQAQQLEAKAQYLSTVETYARELVASHAFRIGSAITWPVRKLRHGQWRRLGFRRVAGPEAGLTSAENKEGGAAGAATSTHLLDEHVEKAIVREVKPVRSAGAMAIGGRYLQ